MNPRVLFVDHAAVLSGAELALLDIARHFRRTSRVVLFEDGPFRKRLEEEDVAVDVIAAPESVTSVTRAGGLWDDLKASFGVLKLAWKLARRACSYDVLHANSQKAMVVSALAGALARRPVVWHLHDLMNADHFSTLHRVVTTQAANALVTRVIANSQATREAFVRNGGAPSKVRVVYNGIRSTAFETESASETNIAPSSATDTPEMVSQKRNKRCTLELTASDLVDDAPVVGVFGRLAPWKGQHVLIEALRELPYAHALVVGAPLFENDHPYEQKLRAQAAHLGMEDRVHFLGFRDDVPHLMHACDVVAHTSVDAEPFGRVVVEGMMAGRPVVAARAGGPQEIVESGVTGLLVPPGDPEALAAALRKVLEQPERARALAAEGRRVARRRFSVDTMLEAMEQQYRQIAP